MIQKVKVMVDQVKVMVLLEGKNQVIENYFTCMHLQCIHIMVLAADLHCR